MMKYGSVKRNMGMNDEQARKDRKGFRTTVENTTGGTFEKCGEGANAEVGVAGSNDPLSKEVGRVTW